MTERNLKRQPRAKVMLADIRRLITVRATSSNTKREELAQEVLAEIEERYPQEIPPTEETIIKMISKARNHEPSPLDKPWHLGEVNNLRKLEIPDISAEAVKRIREIQKLLSNTGRRPITIRQAKWISLFHLLTPDNRTLYVISGFYSDYELACSVSDTPFDTSKMDRMLDNPNKLARFVANFYINMPDKASDLMIKSIKSGKGED